MYIWTFELDKSVQSLLFRTESIINKALFYALAVMHLHANHKKIEWGGGQICLVIGCYVPMTNACFLRNFDFASLSFPKTIINRLV